MRVSTVKFRSSFLALIVRCSNKALNNMQMNKTVHNHNTDSTECHQIAAMHYIPMRILPTAPLSLSWQHLCLHNACTHTHTHTDTLFLPLLLMLKYVGIRSEYIKASTNMSHCCVSNTPISSKYKVKWSTSHRTQTHICQGQICLLKELKVGEKIYSINKTQHCEVIFSSTTFKGLLILTVINVKSLTMLFHLHVECFIPDAWIVCG